MQIYNSNNRFIEKIEIFINLSWTSSETNPEFCYIINQSPEVFNFMHPLALHVNGLNFSNSNSKWYIVMIEDAYRGLAIVRETLEQIASNFRYPDYKRMEFL